MALSCTFKQPMFDLEKSPLISKGLYTVEMKLKPPTTLHMSFIIPHVHRTTLNNFHLQCFKIPFHL